MTTKEFIFNFVKLAVFLAWIFIIYRFETIRIFSIFIPLSLVVVFSKKEARRNGFISILVIIWLFIFHYESTRYFTHFKIFKLLDDVKHPKIKFLFPPIGWIMFYKVSDSFGNVEVYGIKGTQHQLIDPHEIFRTRTIGYDNIHRGILGTAADIKNASKFCHFLRHRLPYFDNFVVMVKYHPSLTEEHYKIYKQIKYKCFDDPT